MDSLSEAESGSFGASRVLASDDSCAGRSFFPSGVKEEELRSVEGQDSLKGLVEFDLGGFPSWELESGSK